LGVVTEAELLLVPAPSEKYGCLCFFGEPNGLMEFYERLYVRKPVVTIAALEYMDRNALELIEQMRPRLASMQQIPQLNLGFCGAIYFELHGRAEPDMMDALESIVSDYEQCGGDPEDALVATTPEEMFKLKLLRHAAPEAANALMAEYKQKHGALTTICTDLAVPHLHLKKMMDMYRRDLDAGDIGYIMYGHIGNNHLHVNILPKDEVEYRMGLDLYRRWIRRVIEWDGTISAEHGIGKQKSTFVEAFVGQENYQKLWGIKRCFDRNLILNNGTIFARRICTPGDE
jgi:D-lactate dehydrogenase (cytochrome)